MNLQGKPILITVGASGIGLEAARQFELRGAKVISIWLVATNYTQN